jgi:Spy/CpxP family protein refolding chaperone
MKTTLKKILLGTGFAAASLVTLASASWSMNHGMSTGHDPQRMLAHMAQRLDLTEEQQAQVKSLLTSARESSAADRERLTQLRKELHEQGEAFDEGRVQALADEVGEITSRLVYQAASTQARLYQLLTPEQREQMAEIMEKRGERRGKWHRGGGESSGN